MIYLVWSFVAIFLLILVGIVINNERKDPEKILGVYSQVGKWFYLKYYAFLVLLHVRQFLYGLWKSDVGLGTNVQSNHDHLDLCKPLSSNMKAFDAVFFQAVDNRNGYYVCGGVERRQSDKINGVFYIVVPGLGLLRSEHLPKTNLDASKSSEENAYEGGGIRMKMIEPMKRWKVAYTGMMWLDSKSNLMEVELDAEWTSNYPHFLFDTGLDKRLIAEAIASEPWSSELFLNLRKAHQIHYEQMGYLKGTLKVNGEMHNLDMSSCRDHTFGHKRDWTLMHRYAFHMIYLDDNARICVGVVSQPCTTSHMVVGYLVTPKRKVHRITRCNLRLFEHGENGTPPKDLAFSITANFKRYDCSISTLHECEHFKGNDIEARLIERFTVCRVNGTSGRGIAEWHYNNVKSAKI